MPTSRTQERFSAELRGGDADDRGARGRVTAATGVAEGPHATVPGDEVVAVAAPAPGDLPDGLRAVAGRRPVEPSVAEGEDAAVVADQPVTTAAPRRRHGGDRPVQADAAGRALERGV